MLADHQGHLRFMGASSEKTRLLELFQLQNDEGPCLDCYRTGVGVTNVDLLDGSTPGRASPRTRWRPVSARCTPSRCGCAAR